MSETHVQRELLTKSGPYLRAKVYRVTCTCGWQSQWTHDWRRSLDSHFYRLQRGGASSGGETE